MSADINFRSYSDLTGFAVNNCDINPDATQKWSDALKVSHCRNFQFDGGSVIGGSENAIDCNRNCDNGLFNRMRLLMGEQASIVVKGGCTDIVFADIEITPAQNAWCDVLWDDWSDQSQLPSTGLLKNVTRTDGKPVRLVVGRGVWPVIQSGNVRRCYILSFGLRCYNCGKGILRKLNLV
jgi:hypothetical protein